MEKQRTPGPWKTCGSQIWTDGGMPFRVGDATVAAAINGIDHNANARLMAAAPELLEAARQIQWKLNRKESPSGKGDDCEWAKIDINDATVRMLISAIAKAEGK